MEQHLNRPFHDELSSEDRYPDPASTLHLLDSEIKDIQTEEQRRGWNPWVILGATSGLGWLLTGELQTGTVDWGNVVKVLLTALFLIDGATWCSVLFDEESKPTSEVRFRWSHSQYRSNRGLPAFTLVRSLGILLVAYSCGLFDWHVLAPVTISYVTTALLMSLLLIGSFTPFFAVTNVRNKWSYVFVGLALVPILITLVFLLPLLPLPEANHIREYRIGGLIAGMIFLVGLSLRPNVTSVAVPLLKELRRKLVAGRIDPINAIHEADIISGGMQVADALKEDLLDMLALFEQLDDLTENAALAIISMEKNFPRSDDDSQTVTEKLKTHAALREGYKSFLEQRAQLIEKHKEQAAKFNRKVNKFSAYPWRSQLL